MINSIMIATMEPRLFNLDLQLLNDSVLTLIAIFILFLAASYFLFNPARNMLDKRRDRIAGDIESAKKDKEDANALKANYEDKLKNVKEETEQILSDARKKAIDNEAKIINQAKEEANRIIERARAEAELEKQKVTDDVKREIISVASMMAGKIVATSIDENEQVSLINETLKEMGDSTWLS